MDCCSTKIQSQTPVDVAEALSVDPLNAPAPQEDLQHHCRSCDAAGRPVTRKTVLLMLKPELLDRAGEADYRFCPDPECRVIYFTLGDEVTFVTDDLRVRVGLKQRVDPIPLCYCFGFTEADAREEILASGTSSIPQRITELIKQKMCACPARNPSGACCLGEVNRTIKRLTVELSELSQLV
jgi:hypothetical protein